MLHILIFLPFSSDEGFVFALISIITIISTLISVRALLAFIQILFFGRSRLPWENRSHPAMWIVLLILGVRVEFNVISLTAATQTGRSRQLSSHSTSLLEQACHSRCCGYGSVPVVAPRKSRGLRHHLPAYVTIGSALLQDVLWHAPSDTNSSHDGPGTNWSPRMFMPVVQQTLRNINA